MPYDDPDREDPMMLVGVALPAGDEAGREMAAVFAEELARLGYGEQQILEVFRQPFYAGAHTALRQLGDGAITAIVREAVGVWSRVRIVDRDGDPREDGPCAGGCDHE